MAIDQPTNPPDWGRYIIAQPGMAPVGNPIRWGGVASTPIGNDIPPSGPNNLLTFVTPPIVNAAAADGYVRSWSIIGSLKISRAAVYETYPGTPRPGSYPIPITANGVNVSLQVVVGVGQISFVQTILLMAGGEPTLGLCNTQASVNGGPYAERLVEEWNPLTAFIVRPFAAVSSIVGNSIAICGVYELGEASEWPDAVLSIGIAPYAAGEKL